MWKLRRQWQEVVGGWIIQKSGFKRKFHRLPAPTLGRTVHLRVYLPTRSSENTHKLPLVLVNDGQDFPRMDFDRLWCTMMRSGRVRPCIVVGIDAGDRLAEYGTADQVDYKGRGAQSAAYQHWVLEEALPYLAARYPISSRREDTVVAGFSLGGLSALDMAWWAADRIGQVGVFSGALWWRSAAYKAEDPDADRIIHDRIAAAPVVPPLRVWTQAGTLDETEDRNGNGVIDAIDDTRDLVAALQAKGLPADDVTFYLMEGGRHEPLTWGQAMPHFLEWVLPAR